MGFEGLRKKLGKIELGLAATAAVVGATGGASEAEAQQLNARPGEVETVGKANKSRIPNSINERSSIIAEVVRSDGSIVQVVDGRAGLDSPASQAKQAREEALARLRARQQQ